MKNTSTNLIRYDELVLNTIKRPKTKIEPIWEGVIGSIYELRKKGLTYSEIAEGIERDKSYRSSIWHFQRRILMLKSPKKQTELYFALKQLIIKIGDKEKRFHELVNEETK